MPKHGVWKSQTPYWHLFQYMSRMKYMCDRLSGQHLPWWCHQMETFSALLPFVRGIHRLLVNSPHKDQWCRALMFSLICTWANSWINNGDTGDLRRQRAHYDVIVMHICRVASDSHFRGNESHRHHLGIISCHLVSSSSDKGWRNTLRPRQNGRHFPDDIFQCIFLNENV